MKNMNASKEDEDEAESLLEDTFVLTQGFSAAFGKYSTSKGHMEIRKESPKFVVTMKLERKAKND